jgi:hypothetical protein
MIQGGRIVEVWVGELLILRRKSANRYPQVNRGRSQDPELRMASDEDQADHDWRETADLRSAVSKARSDKDSLEEQDGFELAVPILKQPDGSCLFGSVTL